MPQAIKSDSAATPDPMALARDLRAVVSRLVRRLREVGASDDLTPSQTAVLARIGKRQATTASDLATLERVRPQSMAATIAALTDRGLVGRQADPEDGRRQIVRLTPEGQAVFDGNVAARGEWLAEVVRTRYDDAERETLADAVDLLERMLLEQDTDTDTDRDTDRDPGGAPDPDVDRPGERAAE